MENRWTDKQEEAINIRGTSVIVSAAAGSGKTSVLVERLLRQIISKENKIPADRIAVVTFTNDAAAEMKQRLMSALSIKLRENPKDLWLNKQSILLQSAHISTIHSFCFELIRDNIESFDISSGFRIMDESEYKVAKGNAISEVFDYFYTEHHDQIQKTSEFFSPKNDKILEEIILKLYSYIESIPFYEDWLDEIKKGFLDISSDHAVNLISEYQTYITEQMNTIIADSEMALNLAYSIGAEKAAELINSEVNVFINNRDLLISADNSEWDSYVNMFKSVSFDRIAFPKFEKNTYEYMTAEQIKKIRTDYKKNYNLLVSEELFTVSEISSDFSIHHEMVSNLMDLLNNFIVRLERYKIDKNAISFSDAEQLTIKLLAVRNNDGSISKTNLAKNLSEYYKIIMIDEFQDSNDIQDLIFKMISNNGTSEINGDNMFVVGDVKQSIYKFRHANPNIFIKTMADSTPYHTDFDKKSTSISLNKNFRSSSDVVNFVNFIFENIMCKELGDIDYTESEKLVQGASYSELIDRTTEIACINKDEQNLENEEDINLEARYTSQKIKQMIDDKIPVNDKGTLRPCQQSDFCILVRNKKSALVFLPELMRYNIKAHTDDINGYLKSREISILLNLLRIIDNPLQDIPLIAVLMSPMYLMTDDEIAKIRLVKTKDSFYTALCMSINKFDFNKEKEFQNNHSYYVKALKFYNDLQKLRIYAAGFSLVQLIESIYEDSDFMSVIQLYKDGTQKRANLRLLLQYAKSYEQSINGGLSGFIRYMNSVSLNGGDYKQAGNCSGTDDTVSIKTIHKSKGLEYPFVFLCKSSVAFNKTDLNSQILFNIEQGIGFKIQDKRTLSKYKSLPFLTIRNKNKNDLISEELRLLYVALTRAKEKLFITFEYNESYFKKLSQYSKLIEQSGNKATVQISKRANSMQDWIAIASILHSDSREFLNSAGISINTKKSNFKINFNLYTDSQRYLDIEQDITNAEFSLSSLNKLRKACDYKYDYKYSILPSKLTVSEISKPENTIHLKEPEFTLKKLSGAEKGTAIHTFMQYANYESAYKSVQVEAVKLLEKGCIYKDQYDMLDLDSLERFFKSELYKRINNSHHVHREQKFLVKICDIKLSNELSKNYKETSGMLQGVADCIFEEKNGIVIVDYKTDKVKSKDDLIKHYSDQVRIYSSVFEKIMKKKVIDIILYSFYLNESISCIDISDKEMIEHKIT